jgi:hypothetical protein
MLTQASIVLKSMGDCFLSGYITLADGEKDSRNLIIAYAIARVLAIEFDISTKFEVRSAPPALIVANVMI